MVEDPVLRKNWVVAMRLLISSLHLVAELILCPQVHSWSQEIRALATKMCSLHSNTGRELFLQWKPRRKTGFWKLGRILVGVFRGAQRSVGLASWFLGSEPVLPRSVNFSVASCPRLPGLLYC